MQGVYDHGRHPSNVERLSTSTWDCQEGCIHASSYLCTYPLKRSEASCYAHGPLGTTLVFSQPCSNCSHGQLSGRISPARRGRSTRDEQQARGGQGMQLACRQSTPWSSDPAARTRPVVWLRDRESKIGQPACLSQESGGEYTVATRITRSERRRRRGSPGRADLDRHSRMHRMVCRACKEIRSSKQGVIAQHRPRHLRH
ncbi:hypothetical protein FA95DRAFT_1015788 [Auriscalpium vulgare]|uniref:Uncharacterized protein n=1 Tax=Auriscalpium vulgare TaxID=40419 RepID=A0ACB8RWM5_9AGAM|nr:hypothetical protein FA95DRAFT_1015788 [Auriscalpium vulgare]